MTIGLISSVTALFDALDESLKHAYPPVNACRCCNEDLATDEEYHDYSIALERCYRLACECDCHR